MEGINSVVISIVCCSLAFVLYMQLRNSSNMKYRLLKNVSIVVLLCVGFIMNISFATIFFILFLPIYINDIIGDVTDAFKEGYDEDQFDEAMRIANNEPRYYGQLNFPNYDEDMSKFKVRR